MRLRFKVISIQRNASTRHADHGSIDEERVTVVLEPVHGGGDPAHPNRAVWGTRLAFGEVRLAELPVDQAGEYELHGVYAVTIEKEDSR